MAISGMLEPRGPRLAMKRFKEGLLNFHFYIVQKRKKKKIQFLHENEIHLACLKT